MKKAIRILSCIAIALIMFSGVLGISDINLLAGDVASTGNTATTYAAGDVNGDGKVNVNDLIRLSQYLAGWEVELYPKQPTPSICEHIEEVDRAVAPTCGQAGKTKGKHCKLCGAVIVPQVEIPATGEHTYNNACDADCNICGGIRSVPEHIYLTPTSMFCSVCGQLRTDIACTHAYKNACDNDCELCGEIRIPPHKVSSCGGICAICGEYIQESHQYVSDCHEECLLCGKKRTTSVAHKFNFVCSGICMVCNRRVRPDACVYDENDICIYCGWPKFTCTHEYSNACDDTCNICGEKRTVVHAYNDGVITTNPTHTEFGVKTFTCTVCGETKTEALAKIEQHTFGAWTNLSGSKHERICACGQKEQADHTFDEGTVTVAPTAESDGIRMFVCTACSASYTEAIPATDEHVHVFGAWTSKGSLLHERVCACGKKEQGTHKYGEGVVTLAPTPSTPGVRTYTCTKCEKTKTEEIPTSEAHVHFYAEWVSISSTQHQSTCSCGNLETRDHEFTEGVVTTEPTTKREGTMIRYCLYCEESITETIPKLHDDHVHSFGDWYSPSGEYHERACACGEVEQQEHDYDEGVMHIIPTTTSHGVILYTCSVCGSCREEDVPIDTGEDHSYGAWHYDDAHGIQNHVRVCADCGKVDVAQHVFDEEDGVVEAEPTHLKYGKKRCTCIVCGKESMLGIEPTPEHEWGEWKYDEENKRYYRRCICGKYEYSDTGEEGSVETHTHVFGAWTSTGSLLHERVCACGKKEQGTHKYGEGVVTLAPTPSTPGVRTYTCTKCDKTKTEEIPTSEAHVHFYAEWVSISSTQHQSICSCGKVETRNHEFTEGVVTTEPTTKREGTMIRYCLYCEESITETIPKLHDDHVHSFGDWHPNDTVHERACSCGEKERQDHSYDEGAFVSNPTATSHGIMVYTCTICGGGRVEDVPIDKDDGHTYGEWTYDVSYGTDVHVRFCSDCGKADTAKHVYNEEDGVVEAEPTHLRYGKKRCNCVVCGREAMLATSKLPDHEWGEWKYDEENKRYYRRCICGKYEYSDTNPNA